ncbi:MAG: TlpA family protein disulfide reductase [Gammaproteobacteria bacterium]|nr:TlpA family protein disulfide reductase [Gammaproteobacteria bacterium]MCP5137442.1 TlpA family protein disulfide reductase [Gammaproteobacteria bacterium]
MLLVATVLAAQEELQPALTPVEGLPTASDFELRDLEGKTHRLSDYAGQVTIVNFWATWCPPCRREMPSMQRAWEELRDHGVIMLAIDVGEDEETVFQFTADYPVEFPLLFDLDSKVVQAYPVKGLPTTYIIDKQGRIAFQAIGGRDWDDAPLLEQIIRLQKAP